MDDHCGTVTPVADLEPVEVTERERELEQVGAHSLDERAGYRLVLECIDFFGEVAFVACSPLAGGGRLCLDGC